MEQVIQRESAYSEVLNFLDSKKIGLGKRKTYEASIEDLTEAIEYGWAWFSDDKFCVKLKHPITSGDNPFVQLSLKTRIDVGALAPLLKRAGIDVDARYLAYLCALSDIPIGVAHKIDTVDLDLLRSYINFFI